MKHWSLVIATMLAGITGFAAAADYDGSKELLCATTQAIDCGPDSAACLRGTPNEIGVPHFLRIDFSGKRIVGPKRATPILRMESNADQILLQGFELDFGWTLALDKTSGKMTSTLVDRNGVIAMFGSCTLP